MSTDTLICAVNKALNEALEAATRPLDGRAPEDRWDDGYLNGIKACGAIVQAAMRRAALATPPTEPARAAEVPSDERDAFESWAHASGFNIHRDETEKYVNYHRATTRFARDGWLSALAWAKNTGLLATPTPAPQPAAPSEIAAENCRLYAARHRKEPWAKEILRMLADQGIKGSPLRAAPSQPAAEAPSAAPSAAAVRETRLKAAMQRFDKEGRLPGMISAFETHFGQTWTDPDWRQEASVWSAAWSAALATAPHPQPAPSEAPSAAPSAAAVGAREIIEQLIDCHDEPTCPAVAVAREWLATARRPQPAPSEALTHILEIRRLTQNLLDDDAGKWRASAVLTRIFGLTVDAENALAAGRGE